MYTIKAKHATYNGIVFDSLLEMSVYKYLVSKSRYRHDYRVDAHVTIDNGWKVDLVVKLLRSENRSRLYHLLRLSHCEINWTPTIDQLDLIYLEVKGAMTTQAMRRLDGCSLETLRSLVLVGGNGGPSYCCMKPKLITKPCIDIRIIKAIL